MLKRFINPNFQRKVVYNNIDDKEIKQVEFDEPYLYIIYKYLYGNSTLTKRYKFKFEPGVYVLYINTEHIIENNSPNVFQKSMPRSKTHRKTTKDRIKTIFDSVFKPDVNILLLMNPQELECVELMLSMNIPYNVVRFNILPSVFESL